ncbi:hypothetical protein [Streptomyces sp. CBMA156]|uniref:hypothetical protein n=1 Tax=Streptomyces sp. CBMA156 TaxID=1930280 RepID=UPI00166198AA|nr:hypothetical protein [Streptomyces sp. CBMA156]MBD0673282.1 hypothetical protein [Streptomyces sp. CBMA156]
MPPLLHAVARNPALPPDLLGRLLDAADADEELACALAERTDLDPAQVRRLAEGHQEAAVQLAVGGLLRAEDVDPAARPDAALALLDQGRGTPAWAPLLALAPNRHLRIRLASCPGLPDGAAEVLAADQDTDVVAELGLHTRRPDLLGRIARHPEAEVRLWVAANETAPPQLLTTLLTDHDARVRAQAAGNPATPGPAAAGALTDLPPVRQRLAAHPGLPAGHYHRLAEDDSPWVRCVLAENPGIDLPLMHRLAADRDDQVRRRLAHHPSVPLDLLGRLAVTVRIGPALLPRIAAAGPEELTALAASPEPRVRMLVARHRGLPGPLRDRLAGDRDASVVTSVAPHPGLTPALLTGLLDRFGSKLATALAANPDAPGTLLDRIAAAEPVPAKALRAVAAHRHATPGALARCLASPDPRTAEAAARNPALPPEVLRALVR